MQQKLSDRDNDDIYFINYEFKNNKKTDDYLIPIRIKGSKFVQ